MKTGQKLFARKAVAFTLLMFMLTFGACATAPFTGRSQLILVGEDQLQTLGIKSYQEVLAKSKLSQNQALVAEVRRLGQKVAEAAKQLEPQRTAGYNWEFNLIEDDQANAFALPGGKVAVYTGILPYTQNETGLAAVVSHEVSHVIARHGAERMSQSLLAQLGQEGLNIALSQASPVAVQAANMAYGVGAQVGFILPYSRVQELEADRAGLILMARAGYDPRQAVAFWQRMSSQANKAQVPVFLSTHPTDETRIKNIEKYLPEAMQYYH